MKLFEHKLNHIIIPKWIPTLIFIVALIGFADAAYLTVEHYLNKIPPCTVNSCEIVLTSSYAKIFGIPTALFGSIYYLILSVFLFIFFDTEKEIYLRIPIFLSALGVLASIYFVFIMVFVIKAFCPYCAVSALTSSIIFIISLYTFIKFRHMEEGMGIV